MPEITNMGFINDKGEHITRCWNTYNKKGLRMYEVPTRPEDIKPESVNYGWTLPEPTVSMRGHFGKPGTTEGT